MNEESPEKDDNRNIQTLYLMKLVGPKKVIEYIIHRIETDAVVNGRVEFTKEWMKSQYMGPAGGQDGKDI